jgi:hypothetical protein
VQTKAPDPIKLAADKLATANLRNLIEKNSLVQTHSKSRLVYIAKKPIFADLRNAFDKPGLFLAVIHKRNQIGDCD